MNIDDVSGVILAGGLGSRLGGEDKGLVEVANRPMIFYVIDRFRPQVGSLVINANRNISRYAELGFPIIEDSVAGYAGPLAGISAALEHCDTAHLATTPCDAPFLPQDFVTRLHAALEAARADISVAVGGGRPQPAFALISTRLKRSLSDYLDSGGRKISTWYRQNDYVEVDFGPDAAPFANVNSPEDLAAARNRVAPK